MKKEFEALEEIGNIDLGNNPYKTFDANKLKNVYSTEFTALYKALTELKTIKESKSSEALDRLIAVSDESKYWNRNDYVVDVNTIKQTLLKTKKLEKENELLKEIIKGLFAEGRPLELFTDDKGMSQIIVNDDSFSISLGEFNGVDLDKKIKEVLDNE